MDFNDNNQLNNDAGFEAASASKESFDTQQKPAENAESNDTTPTRRKIEIKKREAQLIEVQRHKWRIFSPKNVYFYRHVTPSVFASILHFISLICSCLFMVFVYKMIKKSNISEIDGIGVASEFTLVGYMWIFLIFIISFLGNNTLRDNLEKLPIKRYWLAMMANTFNRIVLNHLKVTIYICSAVGFALIISDGKSENILELIMNGVISDYIYFAFMLLSIIIFYRSFRFCFKSLS